MKKILAGGFALMLGVSAVTWAASPEWIFELGDDGILHIYDDGDTEGAWVCDETCQYYYF